MQTKRQIQKFSGTITFKFILTGIISLLLLIPAGWIKSLILEREMRNEEVIEEISSVWGYQQDLIGPILTIPFIIHKTIDDKVIEEFHKAHFLPQFLEVDANINPQQRYRGIYTVVVYESETEITGSFSFPDFEGIAPENSKILWDQAYLNFGITDMRGIQNDVAINWNGEIYNVIPGNRNSDMIKSGFHTKIPFSENELSESYNFKIHLSLNGSKSLNVFPVGKTTRALFQSSWSGPSFHGNFLPDERNIDESGFEAEWNVTHLNRNYPQKWIDNDYSIQGSDFGVELIRQADHYQKSYRSVKYAMMFIALTFLFFLLIEILNHKRLHPIQYFLTGLALIIFYSLLISLSEQIGFNRAYLISSLAVVSLISYYIWSNFRKLSYALTTFSILAGLYLFLFIILRLQEYALLFGSIGLFTVLLLFMVLTRRINWYREDAEA